MKSPRILIAFGSLSLALGSILFIIPSAQPSVASAAPLPVRSAADSFQLPCASVVVASPPQQCGTQASSCKNCHEVKGEDPVNTEGEWHVSHAFGDFCEFCHGGNVQATDKDAAHQGLIEPLGDVQANCSACHDDYAALAQPYAAALGVTIGTGNGSTPPPDQGAPGSSQPEPTPVPQPALDGSAGNTTGMDIVDYSAQYFAGSAASVSTGNLIVGGLLAVAIVGGGAFVYWNEKRLRRADRRSPSAGAADPASPVAAIAAPVEASGNLSPELARLLPTLQSLDPRTLRALRVILADRRSGEKLLQSLSLVNFAVLEEMKRLDKRELSLLLALAAES